MSDWIEWKGGECPVSHDTRVSVKLRNQNITLDSSASDWSWSHYGSKGDIVAYKVIEKEKQEQLVVDKNGWIVWNGGFCPSGSDDMVEIRMRNGNINSSKAGRFVWAHHNPNDFDYPVDIVAYRVLEEPKPKYLSLEGQDLYGVFMESEDRSCSCHINPPCGKCTDPGNPRNLIETEEYWVEQDKLPPWSPLYYWDEKSQSMKDATEPVIPSRPVDLVWGSW